MQMVAGGVVLLGSEPRKKALELREHSWKQEQRRYLGKGPTVIDLVQMGQYSMAGQPMPSWCGCPEGLCWGSTLMRPQEGRPIRKEPGSQT